MEYKQMLEHVGHKITMTNVEDNLYLSCETCDQTFVRKEKPVLKYSIERDTDPHDTPRDWSNLGTMVCFHSRYNLGDKHQYRSPDDLMEFLIENKDDYLWLPLFLYDHSGLSMNTGGFSCPWDSGQVGVIYAKKGSEGLTDEQILSNLKSEVEVYDQYLQGDVWGFIIEDQHGEHYDSCWGFYGYDECEQEAKSMMEYYINKEKK